MGDQFDFRWSALGLVAFGAAPGGYRGDPVDDVGVWWG